MNKVINYKKISYRVTYLEMAKPPSFPWPSQIYKKISVLLTKNIPTWYFLFLYKTVGNDYNWTDWLNKTDKELNDFINDENVFFYTLIKDGWTAGFFILDYRDSKICDLSYLGLVPDAIGIGLGKFLLKTAILMAWDKTNINRLTVNTCNLDHKSALPLYQKFGFSPIKFEEFEKYVS